MVTRGFIESNEFNNRMSRKRLPDFKRLSEN